MKSIEERSMERIYGLGRGKVVSPKKFLDLGRRENIDKALSSLAGKGKIRRIARGLYLYPKVDAVFGESPVDPDEVARALVSAEGARLQPTGAYAANILGLSDQVPAKFEYLTDADDRRVGIDTREIRLRRTTPRTMKMAGRMSGLITQAFRYLKKENITQAMIDQLAVTLSEKEKGQLRKDLAYPPAWIADYFREIMITPSRDEAPTESE